MTTVNPRAASVHASRAGVTAEKANNIEDEMVNEIITRIRKGSDEVRTEAWQSACEMGAGVVKPLAGLMADEGLEVARAAKRGLWKVVRHAGRPAAEDERKAVVEELVRVLREEPVIPIRREVLWMLSEIGGAESVGPIAVVLSNEDLREDARMALERIPGKKSIAALEAALKAAPEDFKLNIAQSLRARGVKVRGHGCAKMAPTKKTNVKPIRLK
ncbi:MAG: HEAT repeat domain-containing protein [Planctomycetota bacterium]|jgi:HEAT repeat protein